MDRPAATLNFLSSKKKWYVYVTVPLHLRLAFGSQVQVRRSTGTADKREAERRLHDIAAQIYAQFDAFEDQAEFGPIRAELEAMAGLLTGSDMRDAITLDDVKNPDRLRRTVEWLKAEVDRARRAVSDPEGSDESELAQASRTATVYVEPKLRELSRGISFREAADTFVAKATFSREQVRRQAVMVLDEFGQSFGNKELKEITQQDLYAYAETLQLRELAQSTIRGRIDKISLVFNDALRRGTCNANPCLGLRLASYGKETEPYVPLNEHELKTLFSLDLPPRERLVFEIITMTGMRLDETTTLLWGELTEEDGIKLFDLTKRPRLRKNKGSARKIPIHPSINFPSTRGADSDPLFSYVLNSDGKTTTASETLMRYIRKVTDDPLKVTHSLRHSFKDRMRDCGVAEEIHNFLTGHSSGDAAGRYGKGPSLRVRLDAILKLPVPWLEQPLEGRSRGLDALG